MLHAPTNDGKNKAAHAESLDAPESERELRPRLGGAARLLTGARDARSDGLQHSSRRQNLPALQSTLGNQAVLRLLHRPAQGSTSISLGNAVLQRKCACGDSSGSNEECRECQAKREAAIQRSATGATSASEIPPIVHQVLDEPGQTLDGSARKYMESHIGQDFGSVRVHFDARAAESARAVKAQAYTVGRDIVFGAGQYAPQTLAGRRLLAHELTHVVQQRRGGPSPILNSAAAHERSADAVSSAVAAGEYVTHVPGATGMGLARSDPPPTGGMTGETPAQLLQRLVDLRGRTTGGEAKGYQVFAVVQIVDESGKQVFVKEGAYLVSGSEHAEEEAVAAIRADMPANTKYTGGKLTVMVNQFPCESRCTPTLTQLSDDLDVDLEAWVPTRQSVADPNVLVKPKTAFKGVGDPKLPPVEPLKLTDLQIIRKSRGTSAVTSVVGAGAPAPSQGEEVEAGGVTPRKGTTTPGEGPGEMGPSPTATVVGVVGSFAAGIAVNLLTGAFREKVESDLAKMPKPKIDHRAAKDFLTDPETVNSMTLLNAISQDLKPFSAELQEMHQKVMFISQLNLMGAGISSMSAQQRLDYLSPIIEELGEYDNQLSTIEDNLDAILEQKEAGMKTAKACDDIQDVLHTAFTQHHWLETGFSIEEYGQVESNLSNLSVTIRMAFSEAQQFKDTVLKLEAEEAALRKGYSAAYGKEFAEVFQAMMKEKEHKQAAAMKAAGAQQARAALAGQEAAILQKIADIEQRGPAFIPMSETGIQEINDERNVLYKQLQAVRERMSSQ